MNEYFHLEFGFYKDQVNRYSQFTLVMLKNFLRAFGTFDCPSAQDIIRQGKYCDLYYIRVSFPE
jgi:hypothetical protein